MTMMVVVMMVMIYSALAFIESTDTTTYTLSVTQLSCSMVTLQGNKVLPGDAAILSHGKYKFSFLAKVMCNFQ